MSISNGHRNGKISFRRELVRVWGVKRKISTISSPTIRTPSLADTFPGRLADTFLCMLADASLSTREGIETNVRCKTHEGTPGVRGRGWMGVGGGLSARTTIVLHKLPGSSSSHATMRQGKGLVGTQCVVPLWYAL
jgi:hypothetical protein